MPILNSYDQVGKKEDVSNIITNIAPTKTPFQTTIGTESAWNIVYQWLEDSLQSVSAVPVAEGANAPASTFVAPVMRSNTTQIFTAVAQVSGTTDVIKTYGRDKELAYQLELRSKELKRNLEFALVGTAQVQTLGNDATARAFGGYQSMVDISVTFVMGAGAGLGFTGGFPTRAALTEAAVLTTMEALYNAGAEPNTMFIKPGEAQWAANLAVATGRTRFLEQDTKQITNVVDVYRSPYGQLKIVMDRFLRGNNPGDTQSDALIFEPDMWKRIVLRNWFRQTLAKVGDSTQVQILGEFGLKHRNFKASGLITNIAAS